MVITSEIPTFCLERDDMINTAKEQPSFSDQFAVAVLIATATNSEFIARTNDLHFPMIFHKHVPSYVISVDVVEEVETEVAVRRFKV